MCFLHVKDAAMTPEATTGKWHASTGKKFIAAPNVRVVALNLQKMIGAAAWGSDSGPGPTGMMEPKSLLKKGVWGSPG